MNDVSAHLNIFSQVESAKLCPMLTDSAILMQKNLPLKDISRSTSLVMYFDAKKWTDFFLLLFVKPLPPCHDSLESMQVFKQHCQIAEEYNEVKKEIALLEERK